MSEGPTIEVSVDQAAIAVEQGALLVDVREQYEWDSGHIDGSLHIPLGEIHGRNSEIDKDKPVYVICAAGVRSLVAAVELQQLGYDAVSVAGGTHAWADTGRALV